MLEDPETTDLTVFAFFLRKRLDDNDSDWEGGNLLGMGHIPVQQQRFDDRLQELCFDAKLFGETSEEHIMLAQHMTAYVNVALIFKNMNRGDEEAPDLFPTERIELDLMKLMRPETIS